MSSKSGSKSGSKSKSESKVEIENKAEDIKVIYENDGIFITKNTDYWIYLLSYEQWDHISKNINNNLMYVSAYYRKPIKDDDVVLVYLKGEKTTQKNGFIAVGQVISDMKTNSSIKIFKDKNLNRYATELSTISISSEIKQLAEFEDLIETLTEYKTTRLYATRNLVGECSFVEVNGRKFGQAIVERFFELTEDTLTSCDDDISDNDNNNDSESINDEDTNEDNEDNEEEDNEEEDNKEEDNETEISDIEIESESDDDDYDEDDSKIITNCPMMMITCEKLRKDMTKLNKKDSKVKLIIMHYKYCSKCDITNNNCRELTMTMDNLDIDQIGYYDNNEYKKPLDSYLDGSSYPRTSDEEHINFYFMKRDSFYNCDVLIEFSSKVFRIKEIDETSENEDQSKILVKKKNNKNNIIKKS